MNPGADAGGGKISKVNKTQQTGSIKTWPKVAIIALNWNRLEDTRYYSNVYLKFYWEETQKR